MKILLLVASLLQTPQTPPVIRTTTRLVQISVVVHDKKGAPVTDLTKDDFVLTDKGQEQQIRFFSMETEKPAAASTPLAPLPDGVFSNRLTSPDPAQSAAALPNLTVILLDGLNTEFTDQHYMRKAALHVLGKTHPGDPVALYALNNGLRVLHDFTSQPPELLATMKKFQAENSPALAGSTSNTDILPPSQPGVGRAKPDALLNDLMKDAEGVTELFYLKHRVEATTAAFECIAFHLQGLPGRKNLIWISGSFPFDFGWSANNAPGGSASGDLGNRYESFADQIQRVVTEFNRAGIVIYPVDARGLIGMFGMQPGYSASSQGSGPNSRMLDTSTRDQIRSTQSTMLHLASRTGGKAFLESNDLEGAIQTAMNDAHTTYLLSFSPTHNEWNGEFREIKIHVKRPGVEVRYRSGYLAIPDASIDASLRQKAVIAAGNIPLHSTGLTLQAWLDPTAPASNEWRLKFTLDANEISFTPNEKGEWTAVVDLLVLVRDAQGKPVNTVNRTFRRALPESDYQSLRKTGLQLTLSLPRVPGAERARLVARDASTGLVGSVDIPLK